MILLGTQVLLHCTIVRRSRCTTNESSASTTGEFLLCSLPSSAALTDPMLAADPPPSRRRRRGPNGVCSFSRLLLHWALEKRSLFLFLFFIYGVPVRRSDSFSLVNFPRIIWVDI
jgi:hypothetical protein